VTDSLRWLRWIFLLFVLSTMVSQSAMDFFSVIFCGQLLWLFYKKTKSDSVGFKMPKYLFGRFGLEAIFITWLVIVILGFITHPMDFDYALIRIVEFKWILIMYAMIEIINILKPTRANTLNLFLGFMFFISAVSLLIYFVKSPIWQFLRYGDKPDDVLRVGGFFANPMTFAHGFVIYLCLLLGLIIYDFKNWSAWQKYFSLIVFAASFVSFFLSMTRGVWVGFFVAAFGVLLVLRPKISLLSLFFASFIFIANFDRLPDSIRSRFTNGIRDVVGKSERKIIWQANWTIFKTSPLIGVGYGQNTKMLPDIYKQMRLEEGVLVSHAHNQYLHLASGTGVLGLICYMWIWCFFYFWLWKLWKLRGKREGLSSWDQGVVAGLFMAQLTFMIGSLTEANFEHSKVRFIVMLMWAYIVYLGNKYNLNKYYLTKVKD
jgi:O-antigen ligase